MDKKDLKVVDLDDLQPEDEPLLNDQDEVVEAKINIDDLRTSPPSIQVIDRAPLKKVIPTVENKKGDLSILKHSKFKNYKGDGGQESLVRFMTNKYTFDRKVFLPLRLFVLITLLTSAIALKIYKVEIEIWKDNASFAKSLVAQLFFSILTFYTKVSPFLTLLFIYFFPLKRSTDTQIQIFYDGLLIPSEIFPLSRPKKMRVLWGDIGYVHFKNRYNIPYMQILNKRNELLGEVRLDFDNLKGFYEILDTYCPEENPIRILFNNQRKS